MFFRRRVGEDIFFSVFLVIIWRKTRQYLRNNGFSVNSDFGYFCRYRKIEFQRAADQTGRSHLNYKPNLIRPTVSKIMRGKSRESSGRRARDKIVLFPSSSSSCASFSCSCVPATSSAVSVYENRLIRVPPTAVILMYIRRRTRRRKYYNNVVCSDRAAAETNDKYYASTL